MKKQPRSPGPASVSAPNGKQLSVQDAGNNQTDYVYDKFDRLRYISSQVYT